jgi:hypothetical protein
MTFDFEMLWKEAVVLIFNVRPSSLEGLREPACKPSGLLISRRRFETRTAECEAGMVTTTPRLIFCFIAQLIGSKSLLLVV